MSIRVPGSDIAHPASACLMWIDPSPSHAHRKKLPQFTAITILKCLRDKNLKFLGFAPVPIFNISAVYLILLHSCAGEAFFPEAHRECIGGKEDKFSRYLCLK